MIYDISIDDAILNQLYPKSSLSYLELKRQVESRLKRAISKDAFSNHIKKLTVKGQLEKQDNNIRGKPVFYSISGQARKEYHLFLLSNPNVEQYRQLYNAILMHSFRSNTPVEIEEDELDLWLQQIGHSRKDLRVDIERTKRFQEPHELPIIVNMDELIDVLYIPDILQRREKLLQETRLSYASKDILRKIDDASQQIGKNELIKLIIEVEKIDDIDIRASTILYQPIEGALLFKFIDRETLMPYYLCTLPGFSISDIVQMLEQSPKGSGISLSNGKINDGIKALMDLSLIREIGFVDGEQRYSIADFRHVQMLSEYKELISSYLKVMNDIWIYRRAPTKEEKEWIKRYYGSQEGQKKLDEIALKRHQLKRDNNSSSNIKVFDQNKRNFEVQAREFVARHIDVLREHHYLYESLEMFCPPLLQAYQKYSSSQ